MAVLTCSILSSSLLAIAPRSASSVRSDENLWIVSWSFWQISESTTLISKNVRIENSRSMLHSDVSSGFTLRLNPSDADFSSLRNIDVSLSGS